MIKEGTLDWTKIYASLNAKGFCIVPKTVPESVCDSLKRNYTDSSAYRSVIDMQRYRFGAGEYKYFSYPLPSAIAMLREEWYPPLAVIANDWMRKLNLDMSYPGTHEEFIQHCHGHGQLRPTPLILHYTTGGYNTLHQDLYGAIFFPFQVVIMLSQYKEDYEGGALVFTEQVPRAQSKAMVINADKGDAVIFTTNFRPISGTRGYYRGVMKHGVSELTRGERYSLGVIFHDAS